MQIIDNAISKESQDFLETMLLDNNMFPYYYEHTTVFGQEGELAHKSNLKLINQSQFVHKFYDEEVLSSAFDSITEVFHEYILESFQPKRLKANLLHAPFTRSEAVHHAPHVDSAENDYITLLYYVNDSDGDTYLFDKSFDQKTINTMEKYTETISNLKPEKKVSPRKGRLLKFKSNRFHASSPPLSHDTRCVINMIFKMSNTSE